MSPKSLYIDRINSNTPTLNEFCFFYVGYILFLYRQCPKNDIIRVIKF
jgi:hypothetical protein